MNKWNLNKEWTLFLDRDGVINERIFGGYVKNPTEFEFTKGALAAISYFSSYFHKVVVITNQQGIAKNIMTESNLSEVHDYMVREIEKAGGKVDFINYASNLKGVANDRRKPNSVMGLEAKEKFPSIDFGKSIMIGDTDTDIDFGKNLGMKTIRIVTEEPVNRDADLFLEDLLTFKTLLEYEVLT